MNGSHNRLAWLGLLGTLVLACGAAESRAAIESRDTLKTYFETGDVPTQEQFADVIDSYIHLTEDRDLLGLRTMPGGTVELLGVGAVIGAGSSFLPEAVLGSDWSVGSGFLGVTFEQDAQVHYGYLHVLTDVDNTGSLYPLTIDLFVFENVPGAALTVSEVPEPSTMALAALGCAGLAAWGWRRKR